MLWIGIDVVLAVVGLLVLALLALRLFRQVRTFGRQIAAANDRLAQASARLAEVAPAPGAGLPLTGVRGDGGRHRAG